MVSPRTASRHERALLAVVALFLVVQVVVAASAFLGPRPGRFGWQMYSGLSYAPRAWVVTSDGLTELHLDGILVQPRAEIDYVDLLRSRGCELFVADAVRIELADGRTEEVACP